MVSERIVNFRPTRDLFFNVLIPSIIFFLAIFLVYKYVNPAPPKHLVISTGDGEGDYQDYAKLYKESLKTDGVDLEIRPSRGAMENLKLLRDKNSDVDVAFVQDGLGSSEETNHIFSLGSMFYEPIWIFYRGKSEISRFSQLIGKKLAVGREGEGTRELALALLKLSGIDAKNSQLLNLGTDSAVEALKNGNADAAFFVATAEEPLIRTLIEEKTLHLMNVEQAEAITRHLPYLHHLVLPEGSLDLQKNLPDRETHLISPTATLLVRNSLHPALIYLLLKTTSQIHNDPGIFEKKNEFPIDKDYEFPLHTEAKHFYKSGAPFWQRYLPFWLANLVERLILLVIPTMAVVLPVVRLIPQFRNWLINSKIYSRYGELKTLEGQILPELAHQKYKDYMHELDGIEERVNQMKVPLKYSDDIYGLRGHIDFVRARLRRFLELLPTGKA